MTHHVSAMLETYPKEVGNIDRQKLAECIQACFECAQTCTACADACLAEDMVADLRHSCPAGGLPNRLQDVRGRMREPRPDARALQGVCRGLPPV